MWRSTGSHCINTSCKVQNAVGREAPGSRDAGQPHRGAPPGWLSPGSLQSAPPPASVTSGMANHPRVLWLKTPGIHYFPQFCGQISGRTRRLPRWPWLGSLPQLPPVSGGAELEGSRRFLNTCHLVFSTTESSQGKSTTKISKFPQRPFYYQEESSGEESVK